MSSKAKVRQLNVHQRLTRLENLTRSLWDKMEFIMRTIGKEVKVGGPLHVGPREIRKISLGDQYVEACREAQRLRIADATAAGDGTPPVGGGEDGEAGTTH